MVDRLRERAASEGLANVSVEVMDCQALDLPDAPRDVVTCNFGAMFFPRAQAGFNEMCRVLRPGGTAIVTTWTAPPNQGLVRLMRAAMASAIDGFEPPKILPNNPVHPSRATRRRPHQSRLRPRRRPYHHRTLDVRQA